VASSDRTATVRARLASHALLATATGPDDVLALRTGVQDAGPGTGPASLALRLGSAEAVLGGVADGSLVTVQSLRGVPHLHRAADLADLRAAAVPTSRADLEVVCGPVEDALAERDDPVGEVAVVLDQVVRAASGPVRKADLSGTATGELDDVLTPWCVPCGVRHPVDGLFRLATLRARLALVPGERTQTYVRLPGRGGPTRPPAPATRAARTRLLAAAGRLADPLDVEQTATWLGWSTASVRDLLPAARTPGRDQARGRDDDATPARLLPARDPWLRGSDRRWLLGARADRRPEVFRSLHAPGVVLVDGEVAGTWRQQKKGGSLRCEVDAWARLTATHRRALAADAELVAATRGLRPDLQVG